jgi:hypothetical protein
MKFTGTCKNCFFGHNCPDCGNKICEDYVPLTYHQSIEEIDDSEFEKTFGYGSALRIGE